MAEDANGYTVRHGDHYHYIWKSSLQYGQGNTGETIGKRDRLLFLIIIRCILRPQEIISSHSSLPQKKGILPLSLIQRKLSQVLIIQQATVSF